MTESNIVLESDDTLLKLTSLQLKTIPQPLKSSPYWVLWQPEITPKKIIKKPLGGTDWANKVQAYDEIIKSYTKKQKQSPTGLGFVFSANHSYVCIDIDSFTQENLKLQKELNSYTEFSPSGKGTHVIVQLISLNDKELLFKDFGTKKFNKKSERDLFISSGYVTVTGDVVPSSPLTIRLTNYIELTDILLKYFNPKIVALTPESLAAGTSNVKTLTAEQVRLLLRKIDVRTLTADIFDLLSHPVKLAILDPEVREEARDPWLIICQAVHNNFNGGPDGLLLLHEWSKLGNKYDKQALLDVYSSFSTDPQYLNQRRPITIASLIALVKAQQPDFSDRNSKGNPIATIQNLEAYLKFYKYKMRYNLITTETEVSIPKVITDTLSSVPIQVNDIDLVHRIVYSELLKLGMSVGNFASLRDSITDYAKINTYNPVEDYFKSLKAIYNPDVDPLEDLMSTITLDFHFRTDRIKTAIKAFMRKWLIQVVAAANTSTKYSSRIFNNILIFSGPQGIGKTKWVSSIFPRPIRQYCAGSGNLQVNQFRTDNVKQAMELQRTLICNINEIDILFKPKNYSAFKQLLDENTNNMVLPYGRTTTTMTRRTVFIGSTNKTDFLVDQTGNRRITILPTADLNFDHNVDIEQLWAHAMHWYRAGEKWWLNKDIEEEDMAMSVQRQINNNNMYMGDELFLEDLDLYFDTEAERRYYKKVTFRDVRNIIPSLQIAKVNGKIFREAKNTFQLWIKQTPHGEIIPKTSSARAAQFYKCPPVRTEQSKTSFRQIADEKEFES